MLDAPVVEGEVQPAELLQRAADEVFDLCFLGHIGRHEQGFAALRADELDGLFAFGRSAAGDNHLGPFPGIGDGGGAADARGSAGHEGDFSLKIVHGRSLFLVLE